MPMTDGICPSCRKPVDGSQAANPVPASPLPADAVTQPSGFDLGRTLLGALAVTLCYIGGSALHWTTGLGKLGDVRLPQHLASIAGFWIAARLVRGRFMGSMLLVFAIGFLLTGVYEEAWRRVLWNAGYVWGYHTFTLPFWAVAFAIGLTGRLGHSKATRSAA